MPKQNQSLVFKVALQTNFADLFEYHAPIGFTDNAKKLIGARVIVPFGNKNLLGIVVDCALPITPLHKLRPISLALIDDTQLTSDMLEMREWVRRYYAASYAETYLRTLPKLLRSQSPTSISSNKLISHTCYIKTKSTSTALKLSQQQQKILALFEHNQKIDIDMLTKAKISKASIQIAIKNGVITAQQTTKSFPFNPQPQAIKLNEQQDNIAQRITLKEFSVHLLYGITGSGKTHIYARLIQNTCIKTQVLLLVPEINLTSCIAKILAPLVAKPVIIYHSELTATEQARIWLLIKNQQPAVIVGTRSAIFLPQEFIDLYIVDEEHDQSYKNMTSDCMYHARDIAIQNAYTRNKPIVLGSATPSLASMHNAQIGKYQLHKLTSRATNVPLPSVQIVDINDQKEILHPTVKKKITQAINCQEKVLLFINRRGFAPVTYCQKCDWKAVCEACNKYMVWHANCQQLLCHCCNKKQDLQKYCPKCQEPTLAHAGIGTQKVVAHVKEEFINSLVIGIDSDTTNEKKIEALLPELQNNKSSIIVATQMFAKGYTIDNLNLVVVLDMDTAFFSSDLFALEHCTQTIIQVAGRSGRQNKKGQVIIQTKLPHMPLWQQLAQHDYSEIAKKLLQQRHSISAPPLMRMIIIYAAHKKEAKAQSEITRLAEKISRLQVRNLGPAPAIANKKHGIYYWQLTLWGNNATMQKVKALANEPQASNSAKIIWDVDPILLM